MAARAEHARVALGLLLCIALPPWAGAETNAPALPPTVIVSGSGRFVVTGLDTGAAAEIGRWAEDVDRRLGHYLGGSATSAGARMIQFRFIDDASAPRPRVIKAQGYVDGQLLQRLDIVRPEGVDQEDMLEGLCWLLLNRFVIQHQTQASLEKKPGTVPDWLAVGVAQNLFPAARARNSARVVALQREARGHDFKDMMKWEFLPEGRWDEKAEAGLLAAWIWSLPDLAARQAAWWDRLAQGASLDSDWMTGPGLGFPSERELEKARSVWLAQQQDRMTLDQPAGDGVAALTSLFEIRTSDYGLADEKIPPLVNMRELAEQAREAWARTLAERLSLKVSVLVIGQPPEFQAVVVAYTDYLDALSGRSLKHRRGLFHFRPSRRDLLALLDEADRRLLAYREGAQSRASVLDSVQPQDLGPATVTRDPMQELLDQVEAEREDPPP